MNFDDIKDKLVEEKDSVEKALGKVGDAAKAKFGHDEQVDKGVAAADDYLDKQAENPDES
jgi:MT0933-like antitoxin protein